MKFYKKKNSSYRVINTFSNNYQYSYNKKNIARFKKYKTLSIFGLGGSSLCIKAIYNFLRLKIKKKVYFYDNLNVAVPKIDKNKTGKVGNLLILFCYLISWLY